MSGKNVYVTRRIPDRGIKMLEDAPEIGTLEINPDDRVLTRAELLEKIKGRDAVLCLLTDGIDGEVLDTASDAVVFANYAVGFNNIDIPAATERGVPITNTPGVLTDATATHTWALMLAVTRRVVEGDKYSRAGKYKGWGPLLLLGGDITGATLGLVGAGRIGYEVAKRAMGFRMKVIYADPFKNEKLEKDCGAKQVSLDELMKTADFVSIHALLNDDTHHLVGEKELALMKPSAYIVNCARGPILDEAALAATLKAGKIAGAALDVYEKEPEMHADLIGLDNVVLAPHTASATLETRSRMAEIAATNLIAVLRGEQPPNLVNPDVWSKRRGG